MTVFIVLGYDGGIWNEFEFFDGVFSTLEKAKEHIDQDYFIDYDEKVFNHQRYEILEVPIDKFNSENFDDYLKEKRDIEC